MKTLTLITLSICLLLSIWGISYLIRPAVHRLDITIITTGQNQTIYSYRNYKVGDTTYKENVYAIVNSIN